jgi:serine/threonine protein kinase
MADTQIKAKETCEGRWQQYRALSQVLAHVGLTIVEELGQGSCGNVYRCVHTSGNSSALKVFKSDFNKFYAQQEIQALALLSGHASIVTMYSYFYAPCGMGVLIELMGRDLHSFIKREKDMITGAVALGHMRSILNGLAFMHSKTLLHADVKPQNVLISLDGDAKLADFSLVLVGTPSRDKGGMVFQNPRGHSPCSLWYRAAEGLLGATEFTTALDIFSAGAIAFELITGFPAFADNWELGVLFKIYKRSGSPITPSSVTLLPYFSSLHPRFPAPSQPFDDATVLEKLPTSIGRTLATMVSTSPEHRPSTASVIAAIDEVENNM